MFRRVAFLLISLGALASCSSSGDDALPATSLSSTDVAAIEPVATTEPVAVTVGEWQSIPGGPDCNCSDGSPFEIWERPADPTKVMLYFEGGGACFSAETCGPDSQTYQKNLALGEAPDLSGVFDETNPENPLADWSIVYVPYCTGDVHLGDTAAVYSDTVTIDHNGFPNADKGLQTVVAGYPDVEQLLVAGSSAGSIPSPAFAGLAADALPDTEIVTFGDSSAAYPDVPALNAAIGGLWGVLENVPDWPVNEGLAPEDWSFPGLYVQSGTQHPDITFARFDFAYDEVQATFAGLAGIPADDLLTFIEESEADIEAAGVPIASYIAPGTQHTILGGDGFYEMEVEGVRLVDFLAALVGGTVPADVQCVECERPLSGS
ncbi:MAG TPA: pectin acetylesterase-family hydrolase [Ilumatobacteraceae bacterium]|nr:pectin acetylesterase-family hydrolase [Ilumatobacteraceae bacterium]